MPEPVDETSGRHTIPVIDRMMDVLSVIERSPGGPTIRELTGALGLPRTSIYRILNTLQLHDVVQRDTRGGYHLGRRLLGLAARVAVGAGEVDVAAFCQPYLNRLAADLGEGIKLSVLDADGVLVLAVAQGRRDYALTATRGQHLPPHAGAAGKLLLAYLTPAELERRLAEPLAALTPRTITDPKRLRGELARIRRLGWAQDKGENAPSILAYAAPVRAPDGRLLAAISVPFLAGTPPERMEEIRRAVVEAGNAVTGALPDRRG
jgi:DNA-binding IclR family transcriptional regulator